MPLVHPQMMNGYTLNRRHRARVTIETLPLELLLVIFEMLDRKSLPSCLTVCHTWHKACERVLYASPRLSSLAILDSFVAALKNRGEMYNSVKHIHIRGKANYSRPGRTVWILEFPRRLAALVPNVRALTFENVEDVMFYNRHFWNELELFDKVTELNIENSRFFDPGEVRSIVYSFPRLTTLCLSHVAWSNTSTNSTILPQWERPLPVRTLVLERITNVTGYGEVFSWFGKTPTLRHLEVVHMQPAAFASLGIFFKHLNSGHIYLDSFTFQPLILQGIDANSMKPITDHIYRQKNLRSLSLHIVNMADAPMRWVTNLFDVLRNQHLTHISLGFTLDYHNSTTMSHGWMEISARLSGNWRKTLRRVTLKHYPVGNILDSSRVPALLASRFPALVQRRLLDVQIGDKYPDL